MSHSLSDLAKQGGKMDAEVQRNAANGAEYEAPSEEELEKLAKLMRDTEEVRCPKLLKRFTSSAN